MCMALNSKLIGQKIRARRKELDRSEPQIASDAETTQQTVNRIELGQWKRMPSALPRIAKSLGLTLGEIDPSLAGVDDSRDRTRPASGKPMELRRIAELPVYATVEGGEGTLILTPEPVDWAPRPDPLESVKDAYSVLLAGGSMIPRYWPGDYLLINPHLPPRREDGVLLFPEDRSRAVVKEFIRSTASVWHLKRYQPKQAEFELSRKEWPVCHVIIGAYSHR